MKLGKILALPAVVSATISFAHAQTTIYNQGIVGYYNQQFYVGDNYIADQLNESTPLNDIFFPGAVPEGATFTEWDPATQQYLPTSVYDTVNGWSIDYILTYGQGGLFDSPTVFTTTFNGLWWPGYNPSEPFVPPLVTGVGSLLLCCVLPFDDATFYDVVGRNPQNGESVTFLDAASQSYTTTTFENGAWNNGDPTLDIGESAMFHLEAVPEPGTYTTLATGLVMLIATRLMTKRRAESMSRTRRKRG